MSDYSEYSSQDEGPLDETDGLIGTLDEILSDVHSSGSFLTTGSFDNGINPGLEVPGVGQIRLPLSADDAKAIIRSCHASPYGKGSETLVNDSVRKSWELNANQFSLRNPAWERQLQELLVKIVPGLGLVAKPQLLVYEEGPFFLPHQNSEKEDGMLGTLVVSLPSKHEGENVVATHRGESRTFKTSPSSEYGFSYAAWYSDVIHEVKPVTSDIDLF